MSLPTRTLDTMSDAIALSSPNGRMSKRARAAAEKRLSAALFGPEGYQPYKREPPTPAERALALRRAAQNLRDLAARGMRPRAFGKEAERLEKEAQVIECA